MAVESAPPARSDLNVTWIPQSLEITFAARCDGLTDEQLPTYMLSVWVGGRSLGAHSCVDGGHITPDVQAVYEKVPFARYPFPPRPETLKPLDCTHRHGDAAVRSDPTDPPRSMTLTVDWSESIELHARAQTPGYLHVVVNGERVRTISFWDYKAGVVISRFLPHTPFASLQHPPEPGEPITFTVTPEHLTGEWVFGAVSGRAREGSLICL